MIKPTEQGNSRINLSAKQMLISGHPNYSSGSDLWGSSLARSLLPEAFRSTRAHLFVARLSLHLQLNAPQFTQAKTTDVEMSEGFPLTHELTEK